MHVLQLTYIDLQMAAVERKNVYDAHNRYSYAHRILRLFTRYEGNGARPAPVGRASSSFDFA